MKLKKFHFGTKNNFSKNEKSFLKIKKSLNSQKKFFSENPKSKKVYFFSK